MNIPQVTHASKTDFPSLCTDHAPACLTPAVSRGDKAKAHDILTAIHTLHALDAAPRPATPEERHILMRFPGFGSVALGMFPDPVTGQYKDAGWQQLGDELRALLSPEDYASAKRTTFTAFYTACEYHRNRKLRDALISLILLFIKGCYICSARTINAFSGSTGHLGNPF